MLECSIIACILGIIIFFIIGIKCTFPARHQKRKSPDRRPGGSNETTSLPAHPAPRSCRIPDLRIIVNKE